MNKNKNIQNNQKQYRKNMTDENISKNSIEKI